MRLSQGGIYFRRAIGWKMTSGSVYPVITELHEVIFSFQKAAIVLNDPP
jgi:hypothetical protein